MFDFKLKKITNCKWLNLFEVIYKTKEGAEHLWLMCSRKSAPIVDAAVADAVVIVPIVNTDDGKRLVVTREFRVPIADYEYGFPAGLIDDGEDITETVARELREETGLDLVAISHTSEPVYSSAGMTDESCHMVFVTAAGSVSNKWQEGTEDIETLLLDIQGVRDLLSSGKKISAKAWGLLYHYARAGFDDIDY